MHPTAREHTGGGELGAVLLLQVRSAPLAKRLRSGHHELIQERISVAPSSYGGADSSERRFYLRVPDEYERRRCRGGSRLDMDYISNMDAARRLLFEDVLLGKVLGTPDSAVWPHPRVFRELVAKRVVSLAEVDHTASTALEAAMTAHEDEVASCGLFPVEDITATVRPHVVCQPAGQPVIDQQEPQDLTTVASVQRNLVVKGEISFLELGRLKAPRQVQEHCRNEWKMVWADVHRKALPLGEAFGEVRQWVHHGRFGIQPQSSDAHETFDDGDDEGDDEVSHMVRWGGFLAAVAASPRIQVQTGVFVARVDIPPGKRIYYSSTTAGDGMKPQLTAQEAAAFEKRYGVAYSTVALTPLTDIEKDGASAPTMAELWRPSARSTNRFHAEDVHRQLIVAFGYRLAEQAEIPSSLRRDVEALLDKRALRAAAMNGDVMQEYTTGSTRVLSQHEIFGVLTACFSATSTWKLTDLKQQMKGTPTDSIKPVLLQVAQYDSTERVYRKV